MPGPQQTLDETLKQVASEIVWRSGELLPSDDGLDVETCRLVAEWIHELVAELTHCPACQQRDALDWSPPLREGVDGEVYCYCCFCGADYND